MSLTSSVAGRVLGVDDPFLVCLLVALPCSAGAASGFVLRDTPGRPATLAASALVVLGAAITIPALHASSTLWFAVGSTVAGLGVGAALSGTFKVLAPLPAPAERAEFFAAFFVVGYLAFSIPAVIAGFAAASVGLVITGTVYAVGLIVLAVGAAAAMTVTGGPRVEQSRE
ncbi:hypothetical protein [Nakamurella leprariae]|uniref:MFS transporter n=1 Tax=Nakamurella leprariae TaxID=2803911 RepID=A0A938YES0_9ACTN|nr:hypothetical protein [Nakamurella leprariae]MBM9468514.1 hypothetical protein [Nakamurella leprariae]